MEEHPSDPATFCVTGGNGYIGSWLVKSLLQKGHKVHATVRDPAKSLHLQSLGESHGARLRIFRADLLEEGSFDEAVEGCDGIFHVAAPMRFGGPEEGESYIQSNIIEPAVRGTLNLLRGCLRSKKPVRRVVFTSSISTITGRDDDGRQLKASVDENCRTPVDRIWKNKASGWVYVLSKILTEDAAFEFAEANGIDMVSVISPTVAGPFLAPTIPSSIRVLLSPITGDKEFYGILSAGSSRMGSIALGHVEDVCRAHVFLMEQPTARGRYLCCSQSCTLPKLSRILARVYPSGRPGMEDNEGNCSVPCEISSKKLKDLGFEYKYGVEEIVYEAVASCMEVGFLCSSSTEMIGCDGIVA